MGAMAQLAHLYLSNNQIGDSSITTLADACASEALAKCTKITVPGNPASSDAKKAVMDVLKQR